MEYLRSGTPGIDRLLGGGLPKHRICLLYGEAATGKTILSMQFALEAARKGAKVFYIDPEQSFSSERISRLSESETVTSQIVLFRPEHFRDQGVILDSFESLLTKIPTLLVADSITGLYRAVEKSNREFFGRDRELNRQLASLNSLAARFELWVLLTGQVHSAPSRGDWIVEPVATRTLRHWSDVVVRLRQTPRAGVRDCVIEKSVGTDLAGGHCLFRITDEGIEDA
ncbi:MAG TPA: ATPase domain-containing protein [Candidatus Bathyarchaeia archaeon]|nr:ATPase domain-containing protein [Candidatus Bathyarchaeia archaeon]